MMAATWCVGASPQRVAEWVAAQALLYVLLQAISGGKTSVPVGNNDEISASSAHTQHNVEAPCVDASQPRMAESQAHVVFPSDVRCVVNGEKLLCRCRLWGWVSMTVSWLFAVPSLKNPSSRLVVGGFLCVGAANSNCRGPLVGDEGGGSGLGNGHGLGVGGDEKHDHVSGRGLVQLDHVDTMCVVWVDVWVDDMMIEYVCMCVYVCVCVCVLAWCFRAVLNESRVCAPAQIMVVLAGAWWWAAMCTPVCRGVGVGLSSL
jgi:hypothetical protein